MGTLGGFPSPPAMVRRRQSRWAPHARKKGSDPDPKPVLSDLCGLCGETPDRAYAFTQAPA